jgi:hypothetical protein
MKKHKQFRHYLKLWHPIKTWVVANTAFELTCLLEDQLWLTLADDTESLRYSLRTEIGDLEYDLIVGMVREPALEPVIDALEPNEE